MSAFIAPLFGGMLIGLAASLLWLVLGRVAGISSIFAGALQPPRGEGTWRIAFLAGLLTAGLVGYLLVPERLSIGIDRSLAALIVGGLLVGFGASVGGGCTSGHGVCGLSRLSKRSLVAVLTFIATGAITVLFIARLFRGSI